MSLSCTSRISRVEIYARGARVVRVLELPAELPVGEVDLVVEGVTLLAEPGSFGARVEGRRVLLVHAAEDTPAALLVAGETVRQLQLVENHLWRLTTEIDLLAEQRGLLLAAELHPRRTWRREVAARRFADGLVAATELRRQLEALDQRLATLQSQLRKAERERAEIDLRDAQASEASRRGTARVTQRATIRIAGDGPVGGLELSYFVAAARWWPRYTLRLTDGGRAGTLAVEALVAQRTAEDWAGVKLSLSTADHLFDTQLPELPSLRLGRAQQHRPKPFRAAPEGLDRMFDGYDKAFPGSPRREPSSRGQPAPASTDSKDWGESTPVAKTETQLDEFAAEAEGGTTVARRREAKKASFGAPAPSRPSPAPMRAVLPPPAPAPSAPMEMAALAPSGILQAADVGGRGGGGAQAAPEPSWDDGGWRDFGRLSLKAPAEGGRGRLAPSDGAAGQKRAGAVARVEQLTAPRVRDPRQSRGVFDHRHEAAGSCDVASDGLVHRLGIEQAPIQPTIVFRTVPREVPAVFREAELRNPFGAPLLDGPVDIYFEGSLLTTSDLQRVDRAGQLRIGLGTEDRIRVVRNGFAEEEAAGLLGGSRSVSHRVQIELVSSLGVETVIEILDRLPVSDDKSLEAKLVASEPKAEPYDQVDRGEPVRGGLRFQVRLPPAGKARAEFSYRLTFSAKDEIVGGNRRE